MQVLTPHQAQALNYEKSISLSANAGSGKTFVLSKRYIQIALNTGTPLNKIAAITFTEKAAGELYRKIAIEIDRLLESETDLNQKKKLISIQRQIVSANISTIHSFCIDILKNFPVEAELDANFIPIDARQSDELLDLSIEQIFTSQSGDSVTGQIIKKLIRLFFSETKLKNELKLLFNKRKNLDILNNTLYSKGVKSIGVFYDSSFSDIMQKILKRELPLFISSVSRINDYVIQNNDTNKYAGQAAGLISKFKTTQDVFICLNQVNELNELLCTTSGTIRKQGYLPKGSEVDLSEKINICEEFFNSFKMFKNVRIADPSTYLVAEYGALINQLYLKVIENYSDRKSVQGFIDFEDILIKTKKLIELPAVKQMLSEKYSFLMIDEYQDTNDIQYDIFLPLLDNLKKGNLFIVGDEKQSIYMFRDADIAVFRKTKSDIENVSGTESVLSLPDSFRMSPAICLFTNKLFRKLFSESNELFNEVSHSDLICARKDDGFTGEIELLTAGKQTDETSEAELVAARILKLKNETGTSLNWGDITVLVRKRNTFPELEKSLTKFKIPYSIIGGRGFFQQQAIQDIYNFFSFLLDSNNNSALVGILRSPFYNIPDSKIFAIKLKGDESLWINIQNAANENLWQQVKIKLSKYLRLASSVPVPEILRSILNEFEFLAVLGSGMNGRQEIANIEKLIKLTLDFHQKGFSTLYDYVDFLKNSISGVEDESQGGLAENEDTVNLMTIHQAKGLEFKAVFIYKCEETSKDNSINAKSIVVDKDFGILTKVPENGDYFRKYVSPPINLLHNFIEEKKSYAELKRLLYVAITRAEKYLFFSAFVEKAPPVNSFAWLLRQGLGIDFHDDKIELEGELEFLKNLNGNYFNSKSNINVIIPVIKKIETDPSFPEKTPVNINELNIRINSIPDNSRNEIISATKFSVFMQCPLKYKLIYQFGFNKLIENQGIWSINSETSGQYEFNQFEKISLANEDQYFEENISAAVKGKIIHKILQHNPTEASLEKVMLSVIEANYRTTLTEHKSNFIEEIKQQFGHLINSTEYGKLISAKKFYNEYEVYKKENDYFLFGVIDKLIFENEKLVILDYKTDNILKEELNKRAEHYKNQLSFYAYLINGFFKDIQEIEMKILFIKFPEYPISFNYSDQNKKETKLLIKNFINNLRENKFNPNLEHCGKCSFYINSKKCVAD